MRDIPRQVQSVRQGCLNHFVVLGEARLRHIVSGYAAHHNTHGHPLVWQPAAGRGASRPKARWAAAGRCQRGALGGLLRHYHRQAA